MFILPDDLNGYHRQMNFFYYLHVNTPENNNSKLKFTTHCLSVGINGNKKLQTAEGLETFGEGDVVFYRPGNYLSYKNIDNDRPYESMMIFFQTNLFSGMLSQFAGAFRSQEKFEPNKSYFSLRADSYISTYMRSLLQLRSSASLTGQLQKIKLIELLLYLNKVAGVDFLSIYHASPVGLSDSQLYRVVENNIHGNLKLDELAFMCNMSLATFKRSFTKSFGMSPGKWLKEKRLAWSAEQLKVFNRSPMEVFHEAGYEDYSSFSDAFKKMYGVGPKKYSIID